MRTKLVIVGIVLACTATALAVAVAMTMWMGWVGLVASVAVAGAVVASYVRWVRPWHARWGATDHEVTLPMPGDDIVTGAASTTRAISIDAPRESVWPWLAQIGYGRAGWYSYDWIDNDGKPSADRVIPELRFDLGDHIEMLPGWGPEVMEIVPNHYFVAGDHESGTWCLSVYPDGDGTRLVSRWRQAWKADGPAAWFFIALSDPGAFIMEQKMLRNIKRRVESGRVPVARDDHLDAAPKETVAVGSSS